MVEMEWRAVYAREMCVCAAATATAELGDRVPLCPARRPTPVALPACLCLCPRLTRRRAMPASASVAVWVAAPVQLRVSRSQ